MARMEAQRGGEGRRAGEKEKSVQQIKRFPFIKKKKNR